jgi:elongation factor 2
MLAKSKNKHNRIFANMEPLEKDLCDEIDSGKLKSNLDPKFISKVLREKYKWDSNDAKKIWTFGYEETPNLLNDQTRQVSYLHEVKDVIKLGFQNATKQGVLCREPCLGIRMNLLDARLHPDPPHRGIGQILPIAVKSFHASQIASEPILYEPISLVTIQVPQKQMKDVYKVLQARRGATFDVQEKGTLMQMQAHLPSEESFGFVGSPMNSGSPSFDVMMSIRRRKGMKLEAPAFTDFYDRL